MGLFGDTGDEAAAAGHRARAEAWQQALARRSLPPFVSDRLAAAGARTAPWVATMTAAELLAARSHGVRPIATVTGTCWYHYGWSWTEGHETGWHEALDRIRREAAACGANAVVDVRMRTLAHRFGPSMDFSLIGTAVRIDGLAPSPVPAIATVPALEFVRLLEMGIVPVGLAVGARYDWLGNRGLGGFDPTWGGAQLTQWQTGAFAGNQPLMQLTEFWEGIRREAHAALRANAATQGNGVLAHTQFGQLIKQERERQPPAYLGRHIVVGTVIDSPRGAPVPHGITTVVDMRDAASPLREPAASRHGSYDTDLEDQEGAI